MKKICLLIVICVFMVSCTQEGKIKREIKRYMKAELNDPRSYEPVSFTFSEVDVSYNTDYIDEDYEKDKSDALKKIEQIKNSHYSQKSKDRIIALENEYLKILEIKYAADKSQVDTERAKSEKLKQCKHVFRANNAMGAKLKFTYTFKFDKDMNIYSVEEN